MASRFDLGKIPSIVAQQAARDQLFAQQQAVEQQALNAQLQQALAQQKLQSLPQVQAQEALSNQLAMEIQRAQLARLQRSPEAEAQAAFEAQVRQEFASGRNQSLVFEPTIDPAIQKIHALNQGIAEATDIPITSQPATDFTPLIPATATRRAIGISPAAGRAAAKTAPFQFAGVGGDPTAPSAILFNPTTGQLESRALPEGVTDIRAKVTAPVKAASGLSESQKVDELAKAEKVGIDTDSFKDPASGQIDWQAVAIARGRAEGEAIKASNIVKQARLDAKASQGGKPTVSQENFQLYGNRMEASNNNLQKLDEKGFDPTSLGREGLAGSWSPNLLKTSDRQQFEQAQRDFINAVLRRESGAVISDAEFQNAEQQYFPQTGDSAFTLSQKKENRKLVVDEFKRLGGQSAPGVNPPATSSTTSELPSYSTEAEARQAGLKTGDIFVVPGRGRARLK